MFKSELEVRYLGDEKDQAILLRDLILVHPTFGEIIAKEEFVTDFASVPGLILFPGIVPRGGKIRWGAVIHDWIYRGHEGNRFTRVQADQILYDCAINKRLEVWRASSAYSGVRLGGWVTWNKHHDRVAV